MNGKTRIVEGAELRQLFAESPEKIFGYTEWDEPNFSFRHAPCNFYSGTKTLAEEAIRGLGEVYIWRPGMPFNERSEPRNFLWRSAKLRQGLRRREFDFASRRFCAGLSGPLGDDRRRLEFTMSPIPAPWPPGRSSK